MRPLILAACAALSSSCLYTNVHSPRAYRSATPAEVKSTASDPILNGRACSYSLLWLVAWGDAGYAAATRDALQSQPEAILYDVKSDLKVTSYVLGLYSRVCTIVTGKAAKP